MNIYNFIGLSIVLLWYPVHSNYCTGGCPRCSRGSPRCTQGSPCYTRGSPWWGSPGCTRGSPRCIRCCPGVHEGPQGVPEAPPVLPKGHPGVPKGPPYEPEGSLRFTQGSWGCFRKLLNYGFLHKSTRLHYILKNLLPKPHYVGIMRVETRIFEFCYNLTIILRKQRMTI